MVPKAIFYIKKKAKLLEDLAKEILLLKTIEFYTTYNKYIRELKLTEDI